MKLERDIFTLYAVTDGSWSEDGEAYFQKTAAAIRGGARLVQLRVKDAGEEVFSSLASRFIALCRSMAAVGLLNDRVDLAARLGADGVHIGQGDMPPDEARRILGPDKIIGVSAHTVEEALKAEAMGADYLGAGAAFVTGTKTDAKPISRQMLRDITQAVHIPAVAIGGVTAENVAQLKGCGLAGAAVVSGIFGKTDPEAAVRELLSIARQERLFI